VDPAHKRREPPLRLSKALGQLDSSLDWGCAFQTPKLHCNGIPEIAKERRVSRTPCSCYGRYVPQNQGKISSSSSVTTRFSQLMKKYL
jgi:hypothetical protein